MSSTLAATALRVESPGVMRLVDVTVEEPAPGWALVEPRYVGICGTDADLRAGTMVYLIVGDTSFPVQTGHEWSGVVVRSSRQDLPPGTHVIGDPIVGCGSCPVCATGPATHCVSRQDQGVRGTLPGAAATLITFPDANLHRVPDGLELSFAALAEPSVTATEGVARLGDQAGAGSQVLVIGSGTLGMIAAQLLVARGCQVSIAVRSPTGRARAERLGAAPVPIRGSDDGPDRAFDGVIEASGWADGVPYAVRALRAGGRLSIVGVPPRPIPEFDAAGLILRDLSITGVLNGPGRYDDALSDIASGRIDATQLLDSIIPLAEAARAFDRMADRTRPRPKVMLEVKA